jgi:hypothetical protein
MLEMRLAAECLEVWVLQPGGTGLLVREPLHVLEQMHPHHQTRRQAGPALAVMVMRPERVIEPPPVDQHPQPDQFVPGIDNRFQRAAEQITGRGFRGLRTHGHLAGC